MRRLVLVALAACGSTDNEACPQAAHSDVEHSTDVLVSGTDQIAISWARIFQQSRPEIHAAMVAPDGTIGPDISLPGPSSRGVVGKTTALWSTNEACAQPLPFELILQQANGAVAFIEPAMKTTGRATVFDGTRYQVFWTTDGYISHRSIEEDGTLGPLQTLGLTGSCIDAASDGAGMTFVRIDHAGYIVDGVTGELRQVFVNPPPMPPLFGRPFYFAGKFHIVVEHRLLSIAPDSTGGFTDHILFGDLEGASAFYPAGDTMFVESFDGLFEVDANLTTLRELPFSIVFPMGTFGRDIVRFERTPLDVDARQPGRLDLIRDNAWTKEVAVDSPVRMEDACEDIDF